MHKFLGILNIITRVLRCCCKNQGFTLPVHSSLASNAKLDIVKIAKGPDALDWQNLFGPSKNLDKICPCQA